MGKSCFFISRIGDAGSPEREFSDKLLKYIVSPVLEKCGYDTPVRADHITQPGVITTQVFQRLWNDDLVIADLTGSNPNVFYELAVRHVRRKPFIHLIECGAKIPFDIAPNRTLEFGFDIEEAERAKTGLELMVQASGADSAMVQTALSAAVDFATAGTSSDPVRDGIAQLLSLVQEIKASSVRPPQGVLPAAVAPRRSVPQREIYRKESAKELAKGPEGRSSAILFYPDLAAMLPPDGTTGRSLEMTNFYGESGGGTLNHLVSLFLTLRGLRMDVAEMISQEVQIQLHFPHAAARQIAACLSEMATWGEALNPRRGF